MKRKVISVVAWLVATVASVLLATAAVGNVGSWGTDQPVALPATAANLTSAPAAPSTTVPDPVASTTAATVTSSTSAPTATSSTVAPGSGSTTTAPTSSTTAVPQPPPTTEPPVASTTSTSTTTTTTAPPREEYFESWQLTGGWVQLRVDGDDVNLEAAVASPGFTIEVEHNGPEKVEVEFKSESHDSKLTAHVEDGQLDVRTEEEHEDDD